MLDLDKLEQQLDNALKNTPQEWWDDFVKQAEINRQNAGTVDFSEQVKSMNKILLKSKIPSGFEIKIISSDLIQPGQAILYINDKDYERIYGKK
jgi:hypothetical protein